MMTACTTASGAVFFVPETIERTTRKVKFADLVPPSEVKAPERKTFFGKRVVDTVQKRIFGT